MDRVELAYLEHLLRDPVPLWGLVRTRLGYLLLDEHALQTILPMLKKYLRILPNTMVQLQITYPHSMNSRITPSAIHIHKHST